MVDILKLIIMLFLIGYAGFQSNGISGMVTNFKNLGYTVWELLGFFNILSVNITGDGILTGFFLHYIVYVFVGFVLELFNIKKGCFGKLFGKAVYWIIGIPVSFILNCFSSILFG